MVYFCHILALLFQASAIEIQRIPISGTPPAIRHQFTTAYSARAETIVIYGGYSRDADIYADFWLYNIKTDLWTILNPASTIQPDPRVQAAGWVDEDSSTLYIFGGMGSRGLLNDLYSCSLASLSCKNEYQLGDIPSSRFSTSYFKFIDDDGKQRMMLFGGTSMTTQDNELYELDFKTKTWIKYPKRGQVPYARSTALISYSDGVIYVFGGEIIKNEEGVLADNELYAYILEEETWKIIETQGEKPMTRYLGSSAVYNDYLYVFYGFNDEIEIDIDDFYRISLITFEWEYVEIDRSSEHYSWFPRDSYGLVLHQEKILIFGGWTFKGLTNILLKASLNSPVIHFDIELNNQLVPSPRSHHTMVTVGHKLYMFGGENAGNFLNDVWSFDTSNEVWQEVTAEGKPPESRSRYCSSSDGENIIIFGGKGKYGLLSDLLSFNTFTKVWSEYPIQADFKPVATSGACLAISSPYIFIFGGTTRKGQTSDLWVYNTAIQTYEKLYSGEYSQPVATQYASCKVLKEENDIFFYTMFGETLSETPQESIYKFSYSRRTWTPVHVPPIFDVEYTRNMAAVSLLNNRVLIAGGQIWGLEAKLEVRYLDLETLEYHDLGKLPQPMYANSYAYFKRTLYIHGGGDSSAISLRKGVSINSFFAINLDKNCEGEYCDWPCSLGTYKNGESCEICPEGSYADELGSTACVPCPPGKFNRIKGASSENMCYPCNEGFFNRENGQSSCLSCPVDKYCPIGTIEPIEVVYKSNYESNQPPAYAENLGKATYYTQIYAISFTLGMLCFIVIILFRKKFGIKLHTFDLYAEIHNHIVDQPMYVRKNMIGGMFSLVFIISALLFISITVIQYLTDNIFEDKALVPLIIIEQEFEKISADEVILTTSFENFGASCTRGESKTCSSLLQVTSQNLKGLTFISCRISNTDCIVEFKCINCEIETSGLVQIQSTERSAYSTVINLNVTSTSSIPDENSSIATEIEPGARLVFIGNIPTKFYIQMTPSVFKSDVPEYDSDLTGFHVSQANNPEPGSVTEASEVPYVSNLNVDIYLEKNDAALVTYRKQKQTPLALVSGLLGTVFGIMGFVGGVMSFIEKRITLRNLNKKYHDDSARRVNQASKIISELPFKSVKKYMNRVPYRYQKFDENDSNRHNEECKLDSPFQDSKTKDNTLSPDNQDRINALPRAIYKFGG